MITHRVLGLLHTRLVAGAPRQAGRDEYRMGVDDTIAAVRRLLDAGMPNTSRGPRTREGPARPDQTQLAAEYLRLEVTSLVRTIDAILRQASGSRPPDRVEVASLMDAKAHLVRAQGALSQTAGSVPG